MDHLYAASDEGHSLRLVTSQLPSLRYPEVTYADQTTKDMHACTHAIHLYDPHGKEAYPREELWP